MWHTYWILDFIAWMEEKYKAMPGTVLENDCKEKRTNIQFIIQYLAN